jgi:orotidine-5'-phosphate decarboxylase
VERATRQIARLGATFLTVHAYPQTMRAAKAGAAGSDLKILGVSVLTSSDDADLREAGYAHGVRDLVGRRARQALEAGIDGLILSSQELCETRAIVDRDFLLVTPGIRPAGGTAADQKRVMTPRRALAEGADYLVIGRPITEASDPKAAAAAIIEEMAGD